jgi:hypothetical protein
MSPKSFPNYSKQYAVLKAWRVKKHNQMVELFGAKCCICGYNRTRVTFDFHHVDPGTKEKTVSSYLTNPCGLKKLVVELSRCVMVCANCHRETHAGLSTIPADAIRVTSAQAYAALKYDDPKPILPCSYCGKPAVNKRQYCSAECYQLHAGRRYEVPEAAELSGKCLTEVTRQFNVHHKTVKKWLKLRNLSLVSQKGTNGFAKMINGILQ